jgi:hypothetical protein
MVKTNLHLCAFAQRRSMSATETRTWTSPAAEQLRRDARIEVPSIANVTADAQEASTPGVASEVPWQHQLHYACEVMLAYALAFGLYVPESVLQASASLRHRGRGHHIREMESGDVNVDGGNSWLRIGCRNR